MNVGQQEPNGSKVDQENDRDKIISELTKANGILKANISTLYRTARAEIARKNERITELQAELDNLLFKRMSGGKSRDNNNTRNDDYKIRDSDERNSLAAPDA